MGAFRPRFTRALNAILASAAACWIAIAALAAPPVADRAPTDPLAAERERSAEYRKELDEAIRLAAAKQIEIARLDRESDTLDRLIKETERRVDTGRADTVGAAFLRELIRVREARALGRQLAEDRTAAIDLELRALDLSERVESLRAGLPDDPDLAQALTEQRDTIIPKLLDATRAASDALAKCDASQRRLIAATDAYRDFILGNLLWIRATDPSGPIRLAEGLRDATRLTADAPWGEAAEATWKSITKGPSPWLAFAATLATLLVLRRLAIRTLARTRAARPTAGDRRFGLALEATAATAILALPLPIAAWFLLVLLNVAGEGTLLSAAVGSGFYRESILLLLVSSLCALTRPGGLAEAHFGWDARPLRVLRRSAFTLLLTVVPLLMLASILALGIDAGPVGANACQVVTMFAAAAWTAILARVAHPSRGIFRTEGWSRRALQVRFLLMVVPPSIIFVAAIQGYLFASIVGMEKIASSLAVVLAVRVARELALLWTVTSSEVIENAMREREGAGGSPETSLPAIAEQQPEADLGTMHRQTDRILGSIAFTVAILGLLAVWSDLLPALDGLRKITLWTTSGAAATAGAAPVEFPVSLLDLLSAGLALFLTVIFTRNMPGLIELIVLPRLPLEAGARYAIVTIFRYLIGIVGGVLVLRYLGVHWQNVQWLVSAAVLGLSFGLQEIFKNLVSGVILLFEQPIRMGDRVSIGGVSGKVTSIRMRATTVVDADHRDLIIPNSAFITGTVTNWTLSDLKTQQVIRVPIAYGSDARTVERTLLELARAEREVSRHPPPAVTLAEFGEKAMYFELSVEIDDVAKMPGPVHRIRLAVAEELPKRGIRLAGS
jgi:potassium efflux system protein